MRGVSLRASVMFVLAAGCVSSEVSGSAAPGSAPEAEGSAGHRASSGAALSLACDAEAARLVAPDGQAGDQFGLSVALFGDLAVVGAPAEDDRALGAGAAYVWRQGAEGWVLDAKLSDPGAAAYDRLGASVAVSGSAVIVGAPFDDDRGADSGSVRVFRAGPSGWVQTQELLASDGAAGDQFGATLAMDGSALIVGAIRDDSSSLDAGSVYVFRWNGVEWAEEQKLVPGGAVSPLEFGGALAVSGDTVVVGSRYEKGGCTFCYTYGAVYVYQHGGGAWSQTARLVPADAALGDAFGTAVAVRDDLALIGAPFKADAVRGASAGAVYVYQRAAGAWAPEAVLRASDGGYGHRFGAAVGLAGDVALVGAHYRQVLYSFAATPAGGWLELGRTVPETSAPGYGRALAVHAGQVLVGAPEADATALSAGAVHLARCAEALAPECLTAADCADGDACTVDACEGGGCVHAALECDDGSVCTVDACDPLSGCLHAGATACCGDGACGGAETRCACPVDCGAPPTSETSCTNGLDDDCDGVTDCAEASCKLVSTCAPICGARGTACQLGLDCCSGRCWNSRCR